MLKKDIGIHQRFIARSIRSNPYTIDKPQKPELSYLKMEVNLGVFVNRKKDLKI